MLIGKTERLAQGIPCFEFKRVDSMMRLAIGTLIYIQLPGLLGPVGYV